MVQTARGEGRYRYGVVFEARDKMEERRGEEHTHHQRATPLPPSRCPGGVGLGLGLGLGLPVRVRVRVRVLDRPARASTVQASDHRPQDPSVGTAAGRSSPPSARCSSASRRLPGASRPGSVYLLRLEGAFLLAVMTEEEEEDR